MVERPNLSKRGFMLFKPKGRRPTGYMKRAQGASSKRTQKGSSTPAQCGSSTLNTTTWQEMTGGGKTKKGTQQEVSTTGWWEGVQWVDDEEIAWYLEHIVKYGKNVQIGGTEITDLPQARMHAQRVLLEWTKEMNPKRLHPHLICLNTGLHWLLGKAEPEKKKMTVYDPYGGSSLLKSTTVLVKACRELGWEITLINTGVQRREDSNTCGLQVLHWLKDYKEQEEGHTIPIVEIWQPPQPSDQDLQEINQVLIRHRREEEVRKREVQERTQREEKRTRAEEASKIRKEEANRRWQEWKEAQEEKKRAKEQKEKEKTERLRKNEEGRHRAKMTSLEKEVEKLEQEMESIKEDLPTEQGMELDEMTTANNTERRGDKARHRVGPQELWQIKQGPGHKQKKQELGPSLRMQARRKRRGLLRCVQAEHKLGGELKICSNNIRGGMGSGQKQQAMQEWLTEEQPDVCLLQEARATLEDVKRMNTYLQGTRHMVV
jgi:chemotaxis protein histidine kinase CheA